MTESKYGKYIIRDVSHLPEVKLKKEAEYATWAKRVLWLDDKVIEGAFHVNFSWYLKPCDSDESAPHTHDFDEVIGFIGSNRKTPMIWAGRLRSGWRASCTF
jgi:hypothetical protein